MAKITTYTRSEQFDAGDILLKDGTNGTRIIAVENAAAALAGMISAVNRRNIYRGKNLGTGISAAQMESISSGTFDDMFIGDYWTINGNRYDIADMDYWYHYGDTDFGKHHLVMVPHTTMYNEAMNTTDTTEGGYVGSSMYTTGLSAAKGTIGADFGGRVLTHREYLSNAVTNGAVSAAGWFDSTVELMNETMFYGGLRTQSAASSSIVLPNKDQLAILRLCPHFYGRKGVWLRDIASDTSFCSVNLHGSATANSASSSRGVLPVFAIGSNS